MGPKKKAGGQKLSDYLSVPSRHLLLKMQEEEGRVFKDPNILKAIYQAKLERSMDSRTSSTSNSASSDSFISSNSTPCFASSKLGKQSLLTSSMVALLNEKKKKSVSLKKKIVPFVMSRSGTYKSKRPVKLVNERDKKIELTAPQLQMDVCETPSMPEYVMENSEEALNRQLQLSEKFLGEISTNRKAPITWAERASRFQTSFIAEREQLHKAFMLSQNPGHSSCTNCHEAECSVICMDCKQYKHLCIVCDEMLHSHQPFHDRIGYVNGEMVELKPIQSIDFNGNLIEFEKHVPLAVKSCPQCGSSIFHKRTDNSRIISVISFKGRYDLFGFSCICVQCSATFDPLTIENIVESNYWPMTVKRINTIIDIALLEFLTKLQQRMPGSSEHSLLSTLKMLSTDNGRSSSINNTAFCTSWREYKFCMHKMDMLQQKNWMECPSCHNDQHSCHVDGNNKLYRYKSAGNKSSGPSFYQDLFICDSECVERTVDNVYSKKSGYVKTKNDCGNTVWRAAKNTAKHNNKLDVTGLSYCACRHCVAQKGLNMTQGEIFAYSYHLQSSFMTLNKVKYFWCDVACKYYPWLADVDVNLSRSMTPALSVMHAKAHSSSCQILWDGRMKSGTGLTTGEEVEQVNSYLSRLGNSTKHQLREVRNDTITCMVLSWNRQKVIKLSSTLKKKFFKTKKLLALSKTQLEDKMMGKGCAFQEQNILKWKEELIFWAKESQNDNRKIFTEMEELVVLSCYLGTSDILSKELTELLIGTPYLRNTNQQNFERATFLRSKVSSEPTLDDVVPIKRKFLQIFQDETEKAYSGIAQSNMQMSKLADSCKMRKRIRLKTSEEKKKLSKFIRKYNQVADEVGVATINVDVGRDNFDFPWLEEEGHEGLSMNFKRSVVILFELIKRCEEEIEILQREMTNYLSYYKNVIVKLEESTKVIQQTPNVISQSKILFIKKGVRFAKKQLLNGYQHFLDIMKTNTDSTYSVEELTDEDDSDNDLDSDDDDSDDSISENEYE
ncbi:uncharacterized protein LOC130644823 isoform X2 [Hydractinia symbiolongicarpus]|uniref:uncharacterized protein LOC130644823 isoform X2 n=1 Tax=Hydractinia symbiolongicarpus TaxID=13093 RepID=UPI00254B01F4|nr:uncharacterized protein LOC130644823 isoform X2 [Hydractinia symbiolongicarpus]